ncbi:hypothetical protein SAMN05216196_107151 [Lutimaribacter pacificus]|uniref:5-carboxymethyl-2-hydroxymuconate isomerase n=1 Tax=Lutimaribacter pacificus TaxID=391948 RepID=A0A1H0L7H1_9RHOB|nr:hypothetical protein [Lutimaribacter pacificus]SDO63890.1 hypothetical protein SAMN05216196_107151 [Lutimaribacter pacificus]SHK70428.1 hypothetical protein SAMN05444142_10833 [Lutimaribacter pacificus]
MPNVKFYIDSRNCPATRETLSGMLPDLRSLLCDSLRVTQAACQFAVIEVAGLEDQAQINTELSLLPSPERTPEMLSGLARRLRDEISRATGLGVVVRVSALDPRTYVTLK